MLATALFHKAPWIQIKSCKMKSRQVVMLLSFDPHVIIVIVTIIITFNSYASSSSSSSSFSLVLLLLFIIAGTCNYEPKPSCSPRVQLNPFSFPLSYAWNQYYRKQQQQQQQQQLYHHGLRIITIIYKHHKNLFKNLNQIFSGRQSTLWFEKISVACWGWCKI